MLTCPTTVNGFFVRTCVFVRQMRIVTACLLVFVRRKVKTKSVSFRPSASVRELLHRVDSRPELNRSAVINAALERVLRQIVDEIATGIRTADGNRS